MGAKEVRVVGVGVAVLKVHAPMHSIPFIHFHLLHFAENDGPQTVPNGKDFVTPSLAYTSMSASTLTKDKVDIAALKDVSLPSSPTVSPARELEESSTLFGQTTPTKVDAPTCTPFDSAEKDLAPPLGTPPPTGTVLQDAACPPPQTASQGSPPPSGTKTDNGEEEKGLIGSTESPKENLPHGRVLKVFRMGLCLHVHV